jgi:hypothetical protein
MMFMCCAGNRDGYDIVSERFFTSHKPLGRSAICKARQKLYWQAFEWLLRKLNCEAQFNDLKWHGHFVRAIDGTRLTLPHSKEIMDKFNCCRTGQGDRIEHYPKARLVTAVNVYTHQVTQALLDPYQNSERTQVLELIKSLPTKDILLLDRGLAGSKLWAAIANQRKFFVARLPISEYREILANRLLKTRKTEMILTLKAKTEDGQSHNLRVRLLRSPKRKDGSCLVLITNLLNSKKYQRKELLSLYKQRWEAEKVFLRIKQIFGVEHFHSRKLNGILQEIHAALASLSWIASWVLRASHKLGRRAKFKINFKAATQRLAAILPQRIDSNDRRSYQRELEVKLCKQVCCIQAGRSYPRISQQPENRWIKNRSPLRYREMKYQPSPPKWWRDETVRARRNKSARAKYMKAK